MKIRWLALPGIFIMATLSMIGVTAAGAQVTTASAVRPHACCQDQYLSLTNGNDSFVHPNGSGDQYTIGTNSNQFEEIFEGRVNCSGGEPFASGSGWNCGDLANTTIMEITQPNGNGQCLTEDPHDLNSQLQIEAIEEPCNGGVNQLFVNSTDNYYYSVGASNYFYNPGDFNTLQVLSTNCDGSGCGLIAIAQGSKGAWQQWSWN